MLKEVSVIYGSMIAIIFLLSIAAKKINHYRSDIAKYYWLHKGEEITDAKELKYERIYKIIIFIRRIIYLVLISSAVSLMVVWATKVLAYRCLI